MMVNGFLTHFLSALLVSARVSSNMAAHFILSVMMFWTQDSLSPASSSRIDLPVTSRKTSSRVGLVKAISLISRPFFVTPSTIAGRAFSVFGSLMR